MLVIASSNFHIGPSLGFALGSVAGFATFVVIFVVVIRWARRQGRTGHKSR
ncbi:hypothetical protein [Patulibacter defluvii]|uniref:hypothetical protein n=1 Tax=Patulibacter defluvii TaxID=3095358 RepID=UPI002A75962D|nr:hypothetical protein [Patulibacter sp. DM4]